MKTGGTTMSHFSLGSSDPMIGVMGDNGGLSEGNDRDLDGEGGSFVPTLANGHGVRLGRRRRYRPKELLELDGELPEISPREAELFCLGKSDFA